MQGTCKPLGMQFRIAAGKIDRIGARIGRFVVKRRKNEFGPLRTPAGQKMLVAKAKATSQAIAIRWPSGFSALAPDVLRGVKGIAAARIASRSQPDATRIAALSMKDSSAPCSPAWTSPRCRSGSFNALS